MSGERLCTLENLQTLKTLLGNLYPLNMFTKPKPQPYLKAPLLRSPIHLRSCGVRSMRCPPPIKVLIQLITKTQVLTLTLAQTSATSITNETLITQMNFMSFNRSTLFIPSNVHDLPKSKFLRLNNALPTNKLIHLNLTPPREKFILLNLFTPYPLPNLRLHWMTLGHYPQHKHGVTCLPIPLSLLLIF